MRNKKTGKQIKRLAALFGSVFFVLTAWLIITIISVAVPTVVVLVILQMFGVI